MLTEDNAESIAMKKKKEAERKKAVEEAKAKAEADKIAAAKLAAEQAEAEKVAAAKLAAEQAEANDVRFEFMAEGTSCSSSCAKNTLGRDSFMREVPN
mgnify:CR=1 FL=1